MNSREKCLNEAEAAVCGGRDLNYGSPEDNFRRIAALWNAWLSIRDHGPIKPGDVAIMLGLVKDARLANDMTHEDSWVDKAGYAACGYEVSSI